MLVHIVFAHPNRESFTGAILDSFVRGLNDAGHQHTISDLYAMGFSPTLSADEYAREGGGRGDWPVPDDVAAEQMKLDAADAWVFVYPVWWTDAPAILKGWFDRVWTTGWAYNPGTYRPASHAIVLCTAGHLRQTLLDAGYYQAMEAVMLGDRIAGRAQNKQFNLFDGSEKFTGDQWVAARAERLEQAYQVGRDLA